MLIKTRPAVSESAVTDRSIYLSRRKFIRDAGLLGTGMAISGSGMLYGEDNPDQAGADMDASVPRWLQTKIAAAVPGEYRTREPLTPVRDVTSYNNFYEFGMDKSDPREKSGDFKTDPWSVNVAGEAEVTGTFTLEDILKPHAVEERIYRLRCVEAWSMVVPWLGFPLAELLKRFRPTSAARYVKFTTVYAPAQMPGQNSLFSAIDWPYVEGLRMDEAMNPLTFMAIGLYGSALPPQNGAPLRLVVPWKYGFKSIKSIVRIEFVEQQPRTTWELSNPREYGFYSNVNPQVSHPRWSQSTERRLPSSLFSPNRIDTQLFNGYAEQVAHLYDGMDLHKYF